MKKETPPVPFAKVDLTDDSDLGKRFDVQGYPTLKIFRKGQAYDYEGPRDEDGSAIFCIVIYILNLISGSFSNIFDSIYYLRQCTIVVSLVYANVHTFV